MRFFQKTFFITVALFLPLIAGAQFTGGTNTQFTGGSNTQFTSGSNSYIGFQNPLKADTICQALKIFLNALLTLAIPVAVVFLVYAGFLFVWARGNPAGLKKARSNLFYVIIGIGIFMGAWVLGQMIANTLGSLANTAGQSTTNIGSCLNSGGNAAP